MSKAQLTRALELIASLDDDSDEHLGKAKAHTVSAHAASRFFPACWFCELTRLVRAGVYDVSLRQ